MYELFSDPDVMQPVAIITALAIPIIAIAGVSLFRNYKVEKLNADLKMDMLDHGMSAEEIERVIAVKPRGKELFRLPPLPRLVL